MSEKNRKVHVLYTLIWPDDSIWDNANFTMEEMLKWMKDNWSYDDISRLKYKLPIIASYEEEVHLIKTRVAYD